MKRKKTKEADIQREGEERGRERQQKTGRRIAELGVSMALLRNPW